MSKPEPKDLLDVLEKEQLAAVTDTFSENSVVAAGAGSGKTYTLARRFAWLVCGQGIPVDRILTLTFTKKAAAEMYQRIYATLVQFTHILSGEQKARAEAAVRDFSKARIQTLDSYCSSIIKTAVHSYGIRPDYTTDVEAAAEAIQKLALPFVLKHQDNPALQMLVNTRSPHEVADSLFASVNIYNATLTKPVPFTDDFARQTEEALRQWKEYTASLNELLAIALPEIKGYSGKSADMQNKAAKLTGMAAAGGFDCPDIILPPVNEDEQNAAIFLYLKNLAEVAGANTNFTKQSGAIKELRPLYEKFSSLANFVVRWSLLNSLNPLLEAFQKECAAAKRTQGLLTFSDAADLAITVLTENKDMRRAEKNAYDKIMIDEFQDNNEQQRKLLYLLAEKTDRCSDGIPENKDLIDGKLFFVGDEKQSIYKFRGADVSVFNSLKDDLKKNLSLSLNFRSHPALIAAFNTMFGGSAYPEQITEPYVPGDRVEGVPALFKAGKPEPYEAGYKPALVPSIKLMQDGSPVSCDRRVHAAIITTAGAQGDDILKDIESEAVWVADKIRALIENGRKPGDITILLKTLTHQRKFERYLRQAGIPYASESVSGFFDDSPINDMTACLRWCVYPADDISKAVVFKSPFVRLSDNAVRAVMTGQPISPEEQTRLDAAMGRLDAFKAELEHLSIAEAVNHMWYSLGYQFETRWNDTVGLYSELYDFLFELACRADADNRTISWFVDYLQTLADGNGKLEDMDIPLDRKDAVHIMTIHKSKGLEFPVVFVCNTAYKPSNREATAAAFFSKEWGVSINTGALHVKLQTSTLKLKNNYFYEASADLEKLKNRAELDRILYVALTRAGEEVYITGFAKDDQFALSSDDLKKEAANEYIPGNIHALMRPLYQYYKDRPDQSPFTLETHMPYTRKEAQDLLSDAHSKRPNTAVERAHKAAAAQPLFKAAASPAPYASEKLTWNPSHLGISEAAAAAPAGTAPVAAGNPPPADIFAQVDALVAAVPAFTNAHFGTLAHAAIEQAYTGEPLTVSAEIAAALSGEQRKKVIGLAQQLAPCFVHSALGQLAQHASWRQNEYDFKMRLPAAVAAKAGCTGPAATVTVKGQIDLLFETEENGESVIYIVDFKTDSAEKPEEHVTQLACYSHAARQMRPAKGGGQKKTRCWLYYLRSGHAVEITSETEHISLQDFAPLPQE